MSDGYNADDCINCFETAVHNRIYYKVEDISKQMFELSKKEIRTKSFEIGTQQEKEIQTESLEVKKLILFLENRKFKYEFNVAQKSSDDNLYRWGVTVSF